MIAQLDHIGVAVADLPRVRKLFEILGLAVARTEPVPEQGVTTHFLPLPTAPASVELLEVSDPEGTVAQFIKKRGPGIHHLSFRVGKGQLEGLCAQIAAAGYRMIYDRPRDGAHGMKVNFVHPTSTGGLLIEVMEPA